MTSIFHALGALLFLLFVASLSDAFNVERDIVVRVYHIVDDDDAEWKESGAVVVSDISETEIKQEGLTANNIMIIANKPYKKKMSLPYRIKVSVKIKEAKEREFQTYLKPIDLWESDFKYSLIVSLDHDFLPVGVVARINPGIQSMLKKPHRDDVYTSIFFKAIDSSPQPDTATFIHKLEKEREAKEKGAAQDNRSFFAKYWFYILPFLIFAVLSGSVNGEGGAGHTR